MGEPITSPLAQQIITVMKVHCSMPGPILETQCKRLNKSPNSLTAGDLAALAPILGQSVAMFTNPDKGKLVTDAVLLLK